MSIIEPRSKGTGSCHTSPQSAGTVAGLAEPARPRRMAIRSATPPTPVPEQQPTTPQEVPQSEPEPERGVPGPEDPVEQPSELPPAEAPGEFPDTPFE